MVAGVLKLLILPLIVVIARASKAGVAGNDLIVAIIAASVPSAGASFVLARQMGATRRSWPRF